MDLLHLGLNFGAECISGAKEEQADFERGDRPDTWQKEMCLFFTVLIVITIFTDLGFISNHYDVMVYTESLGIS